LCNYCRQRYAGYEKADIAEQKQSKTARLMQIKTDNHCENVNADEEHIKADNDRLISFLKKNRMYNPNSILSMYMQKSVLSLLSNALGANPESGINEIKLYSINSDFCSLKCQDEYRSYRN
jgi:hypothetical protein